MLHAEIFVVAANGTIAFANQRARDTAGLTEELSDFRKLWFDPNGMVRQRMRRVAESSSWRPVNLTLNHGPHKGMELKFRGRAMRTSQRESRILLVADEERDTGFEKLKTVVRRLNKELSEKQKSNTRLLIDLASEERLHSELIHRTKNNLALLNSLIHVRSQASNNDAVRTALAELEHRVQAILSVHLLLDQAGEIDFVQASELIRALCEQLKKSIAPPQVDIAEDLADITLHVRDATPLSLLVNELITNALKHAFDDGDTGRVHVALKKNGVDKLEVNVVDNGRGFAAMAEGAGSGRKIVAALARQMDGELNVDSDSNGTRWSFIFPPSITRDEALGA